MASLAVTERPRRTALRAARLFDGIRTTAQADPMVILEDARIVAIGTAGSLPTDIDVVDLGDATLLPGLVDTHVHLAFDASADPVGGLAARSDTEVLAAMRAAGRTALVGGVTTVRDLGDRNYLSLALRGEELMPTVVAAGPPITIPAGHCHFLGGVAPAGVDGVRAAVQQHAERGVDVIKIMASGGGLTPGSGQHLTQFSVPELRAAVEEAHRRGLPITAHAHATAGIRNAIAAGVDGLEHASFWSEDGIDDPGELLEAMVEQAIVVGATVGIRPLPGMMPPPAVAERMPAIVRNVHRMLQSGVRIVAATDAGIGPIKPHDSVRYAVPQLVGLGMTALEALTTATSVAAEVCGLGASKGRLAPGYDADLLVVGGDPLTEPEAIHQIRAVYSRGRRVPI